MYHTTRTGDHVAVPPRPAALALPALLLGALGIACAPLFVRWSETGPVATAFWRMLLSLPVLGAWWALSARRGDAAHRPSPRDRRGLAVAGLYFAADLGLWHWSIHFTSVANATLLANLAPVFVTLGAWIGRGQRPSRRFVLALALALAGTWTLLGEAGARNENAPLGNGLGVLTAVFYAGYILSVSDLRRRVSTAALMTISGAAAAAALLAIALLSGEVLVPASGRGWLVLGGLALVSQVAGQSLIAWALAHLAAGFSSLTLLLQPVCAALLAWWLLAEPLGGQQALGGAIVIAGVMLARLGRVAATSARAER